MRIIERRPWPARALDRIDASRWGVLLMPLAWLYLGAAGIDRRLRAPRALPPRPPSIGVGNLRVGGSGKTPVVEDLARRLGRNGLRIRVLARGYGSLGGGDEADWLRDRGLGVSLGADRSRSRDEAAADGAELLLLDDSLQSRWRPSLQLVLLLEEDLARPPRPLPAGPAREGLRGLRRADALCVRVEAAWPPSGKRLEAIGSFAAAHGGLPWFAFRLAPAAWVDAGGNESPLAPIPPPLRAATLVLSGLARPESFEREISALLPGVRAALRLADHTQFGAPELASLRAAIESHAATAIVMPEKNRQRLLRVAPDLPAWTLRSEIEWLHAPFDWLEERLSGKK
jgi:tetraacyldisaccharide 4'-kinase